MPLQPSRTSRCAYGMDSSPFHCRAGLGAEPRFRSWVRVPSNKAGKGFPLCPRPWKSQNRQCSDLWPNGLTQPSLCALSVCTTALSWQLLEQQVKGSCRFGVLNHGKVHYGSMFTAFFFFYLQRVRQKTSLYGFSLNDAELANGRAWITA